MKTLTISALFSTLALFAAASAHADQGYDQYRRVVLGDTTIAAPAPVATRTQLVPGSYAQYLIVNGASKSVALAAAARTGEVAVFRTVAVEGPQRQLTPAQAYAKYLGNDGYAARSNEAVGNAE